jgi:hypothetical protein
LFDCYNWVTSEWKVAFFSEFSVLTDHSVRGHRFNNFAKTEMYNRSFVMFQLFANVAGYYDIIVTTMIVLYFLLVLFAVIKYLIFLEILDFS